MEPDEEKRKTFLQSMEGVFGSRYPEMIRYIKNDYRVFIRDNQMIPSFNDNTWVGSVFCCGRALDTRSAR